jgi:hypothetical protein
MVTIAELRQRVDNAANRFSVAGAQLDACHWCKSVASVRRARLAEYCQASIKYGKVLRELADAPKKMRSVDDVLRIE